MKMLDNASVRASVRASVWYPLYDTIKSQIRVFVWNLIYISVWSLVYDSICALVLDSTKDQL